jgi:type III pantothenate kinase
MMNLIFDIGNSMVKTAIFEKGEEIYSARYATLQSEYLKALSDQFPEIDNVIVSSVSQQPFEEIIRQYFKNIVLLDHKTPLPIEMAYGSPETLGKDRIAAAVGAHSLFPGENLLVLDAGTALTIDFVSGKGIYQGGNISPGLAMRFKALHHFTGRLPLISPKNETQLTGKTTEEAINSGVGFGMIYEIEGYINEYQSQFNKLKVLLTGGDANYFAEKLKNSIFVVLNLNLIGLNRILVHNVAKD